LIKAVIFDLDGTLINLPLDYERLFQKFSRILKNDDIRPMTKKIARLDEDTRNRIFRVWDEEELALTEKITTNDEGMCFYRKYHAEPRALVTMQGKALAQRVLKALDLSFELVITREDSLDRVEQLKMAIQRLKTTSEDVLFIGNTEGDLSAAEELNVHFLRVGQ
jgi:HAD superfamily hydrolase (TIGR01549 family)